MGTQMSCDKVSKRGMERDWIPKGSQIVRSNRKAYRKGMEREQILAEDELNAIASQRNAYERVRT